MEYEAVIGLEVHVQLKTKTKAFCGCSTEFGNQPNSQVCPVCLGLPGCLPVLNQQAFEYAVKVALATNCRIAEFTKFDRKNYFYPDLPKNYQISQYDLPIGEDGFLEIQPEGKKKRIGIKRVHLEEDAGKLIHESNASLVDFNRTGIPLLEIVSLPDINSPQEAYDYLMNLKQIIRYLGVSSCDMEKGILRCDANISIKKKNAKELGTKTELKNMNSFRGVRDALEFEIQRQIKLLEDGKNIVQETRLWDAQKHLTESMRTKEEAQDYRYFPEPDLPPFIISSQLREEISNSLPELPRQRHMRFMRDYKLTEYDAGLLVSESDIADFFEDCFRILSEAKIIANWICGPLLFELNNRNLGILELNIKPVDLVNLIELAQRGQISNITAKSILTEMIDTGQAPEEIVQKKNLVQISDTAALDKIISEIIKDNPKSVKDYLDGKENAIMFLVGQTMRKSKGKANPKVVREILQKRLK
ncbi:MAG: glutamyl-tRNA amidotransferase [Omnitrophica WOR_2 bacterium SM23_72]|nr:MAG: glutamyl-tRNA amidotransferase [Omnitrophica WOR_2 bacterium SM23_72]